MLGIVGCITLHHDPRLVVVAGLLCGTACFTSVSMLWRSLAHQGLVGAAWLGGAAFAFGCGVWSTHFLAMQAYDSTLIAGYDLMATGCSLVIVSIGGLAAFALFLHVPHAAQRGFAGVLLGASIAAMHYIGVGAMRVSGYVTFDSAYVIASLAAGMTLAGAGLTVAGTLHMLSRRVAGSLCVTAAVVALHFTAMTAVQIHPGQATLPSRLLIGSTGLTAVIIAAGGFILMLSLLGSLLDQRVSWRIARGERDLRHLAHHDPLTGLLNRQGCKQQLDELTRDMWREELGGAVCCLDLDRFKHVNDVFGHHVGDQLLVQAAERLQMYVRPGDVVARISGDEFVVAVSPPVSTASAMALADRLAKVMAEPFFIEMEQINIGMSIGVAMYPQDGVSTADLLRNADTALYQAKQEGRGICKLFDTAMNDRLRARQMLEQDLRNGISSGQLELHYQPLLSLRMANVIGFEALVRWNHPKRRLVSPNEFIPLAEETGLIHPLGRWVMETACREAASWPRPLKVAVNLSPTQFCQPDLADMVAGILAQTGLAPDRLEIEITENVLIQQEDEALRALQALRAQGVRIALDDFGTGYSSLSYLRRYPFSKIKLDRSFIQPLHEDKEAGVIARAIIDLGHSLGLVVTAEGVETWDQLAFLQAERCDEAQGYIIGRPEPASHIMSLVEGDADPLGAQAESA